MAEEPSKRNLFKALEEAGIPVLAVSYVVAFAIWLRDAIDKLGWRVLSGCVLLAAVSWAIFVWFARQPSLVDSSIRLPRYRLRARLIAVAAALLAVGPVWLALQPPAAVVPDVSIEVVNTTSVPQRLQEAGEAYLSTPGGLGFYTFALSARLTIRPAHGIGFRIDPGAKRRFLCRLSNREELAAYFGREDALLSIMISTASGASASFDGIPFLRQTLQTRYVRLDIVKR